MNKTQIQTFLAPLIGVLASWLATKVPFIDQATWSTLINTVITTGVLAFIAFITGNKSIITQAAALPEVKTVVTDQKTADAIPADNVVAK